MPVSSEDRRLWDRLLALRPHREDGHDPTCPGESDLLDVTPETCPAYGDWSAEVLRENRRADAEERKTQV